jgi:o-succinylbenzoate---CoA ligase
VESFGLNSFSEKDIVVWFERNGLDEAVDCFRAGCLEIESATDRAEQNCLDIVLCTRSAEKWIGLCFACVFMKQRVWFAAPVWRQTEWEQVSKIVLPQLMMGDEAFGSVLEADVKTPGLVSQQPGLMIPTGGSSGKIKFAWHTPDTLTAAVRGMSLYFFRREMRREDFSYTCNLPLWHVSGWMQVFRSFLSDSPWSPLSPSAGTPLRLQGDESSTRWLSVVPTQLARMLESGQVAMLRDAAFVVIGGGVCPQRWLRTAVQNGIHPWVTYGMTETAGMIAGKQIITEADMISGADIFPHVDISIEPLRDTPLEMEAGEIHVCSQSMCLGYDGGKFQCETLPFRFPTGDIGFIDSERRLHVKGRLDSLLNTGGEKVLPSEVQRIIRSLPAVTDCWITGLEDAEWGTRLVCFYSTTDSCPIAIETLRGFANTHLSAYKIPKIWQHVDRIPYDQKGKIDSLTLMTLIKGDTEKS